MTHIHNQESLREIRLREEITRLRELNAEMLEALKETEATMSMIPPLNMKHQYLAHLETVRAIIRKAEGK